MMPFLKHQSPAPHWHLALDQLALYPIFHQRCLAFGVPTSPRLRRTGHRTGRRTRRRFAWGTMLLSAAGLLKVLIDLVESFRLVVTQKNREHDLAVGCRFLAKNRRSD